MPAKQLYLSEKLKVSNEFGGSLLKNSHAKYKRPLCTKRSIHFTMRSSKARGSYSFLVSRARRIQIETKITSLAEKFGIKVYRMAVESNHIHLLIKLSYRDGYSKFARSLSGVIARMITGAQRGSPKLAVTKKSFWDKRPWTRVVAWSKAFRHAADYVTQNFEESIGFVAYKPRKKSLSTLSSQWQNQNKNKKNRQI